MSGSRSRPACHENLECLLSQKRADYHHLVAESAVALPLFARSLPRGRLWRFRPSRRLRPYLNDELVIRHSDFTQALQRSGSRAFVPSYRSSPFMERWAAHHDLSLLSPPSSGQRRLEHKIAFHRFLLAHRLPVPAGLVIAEPAQIEQLDSAPFVCQTPRSEGMEGTFLLTSRRSLRDKLRAGSVQLPLLCRELVGGMALGITLLVSRRDLILSALRRQCRGLHDPQDGLPGIQWLAASRLTPARQQRIVEVMVSLGRALGHSGFYGAASIDFMLAGERVAIIECNPRFTSSTPQLSLEPSLLHGLDFLTEYRQAVTGRRLSAHRPWLPPSTYEGTHVDVSDDLKAKLRTLGRRVIRELPPAGVYDLRGGCLQHFSCDVEHLRGDGRALFYYATRAGEPVGRGSDLGSLMTNIPLFAPRRSTMVLTPRGSRLIAQLYQQVRFARPACSLPDLLSEQAR